MVDCVGGHGQDGALREVVVADGHAGARGDNAGKTEGGGGVDAEGFGYHMVETIEKSSAWHSQHLGHRKSGRGGAYYGKSFTISNSGT